MAAAQRINASISRCAHTARSPYHRDSDSRANPSPPPAAPKPAAELGSAAVVAAPTHPTQAPLNRAGMHQLPMEPQVAVQRHWRAQHPERHSGARRDHLRTARVRHPMSICHHWCKSLLIRLCLLGMGYGLAPALVFAKAFCIGYGVLYAFAATVHTGRPLVITKIPLVAFVVALCCSLCSTPSDVEAQLSYQQNMQSSVDARPQSLAERQARVVRWCLPIGWGLLILSLLIPALQLPEALAPQCDPEAAARVLHREPGNRLFWGVVVPSSVLMLVVLSHELWRRICPLAFLFTFRHLGWQRRYSTNRASWLWSKSTPIPGLAASSNCNGAC